MSHHRRWRSGGLAFGSLIWIRGRPCSARSLWPSFSTGSALNKPTTSEPDHHDSTRLPRGLPGGAHTQHLPLVQQDYTTASQMRCRWHSFSWSLRGTLVHFGAVVADAPSPLSTPRCATGQAQLRLGKPLRMKCRASPVLLFMATRRLPGQGGGPTSNI